MAAVPDITATPRQLLSLGMFIFALDSVAYSDLQRRTAWRHGTTERHMARPASQYLGPGEDTITLGGRLAPEVGAQYAAIDVLKAMADTGDDFPLVDGLGRVMGHYHILTMDETHLAVMAGGIPRAIDFTIELGRVD